MNTENNVRTRLEPYMKKNGSLILNRINSFRKNPSGTLVNEETFRQNVSPIIENIANEIGVEVYADHEHTVFKGRIDTLYGRVNLEYKKPGKITPNIEGNKEYINEVKRQIEGLSKDEKISRSSILGVIFDGFYIIYVKYLNNDWSISKPISFTESSLFDMLLKIYSLSLDKAVSVSNLVSDFGAENRRTKAAIHAFYEKLCNEISEESEQTILLFEQWRMLFREVSGYSFDTGKLKIKEIIDLYSFKKNEELYLDRLIFSIHTYYALLIKLLTSDILRTKRTLPSRKQGVIAEKDILYNYLHEIESGDIFKKMGINNFLEGDFFGWYLHDFDDDIYNSLLEVYNQFQSYNYDTVNLDAENTRDLLKNLYHYLFPKQLRHALGEYYSPDWLAEYTYNKLSISGKLDETILDPCVGSGTFLVIVIRNIIKKNTEEKPEVLLKSILKNVKGFDLNPLAVIAARANYIISIIDLIEQTEMDIDIPVYLCDSMLTVLENENNGLKVRTLATRAGNFSIPSYFVDHSQFPYFIDKISQSIELGQDIGTFLNSLHLQDIIDEEKVAVQVLIGEFYSQLSDLNSKGLLKIWSQVIKNAFAPLFMEKVDYIIGNPPWINWQTLPEDYRTSIQKYWKQYKIFDHRGLTARLGSAHDDISVLLTYVVMDNFLKDHGKLGFIINQNLLQANGGGLGFRKFMIKGTIPVKVHSVDDFVEVQPFAPQASNKTAIIFMEKGEKTQYPVPYTKWKKRKAGMIDVDDTLESVLGKIDSVLLEAFPVSESEENNQSWMVSSASEREVFSSLKGKSSYIGRKGVDTSANAIYWIKTHGEVRGKYIFDNTPENSRKYITRVQDEIIEKDLVFPVLRGKDIKKWTFNTPLKIILPYEKDMKKVLSEDFLHEKYPETYNYFFNSKTNFEQVLKTRGTYKKHYQDINGGKNSNTPMYVLYNIGFYTASPYKVVWKALQSKGMNCCVISESDGKTIIPDHNLVMVPLQTEEEAYYLCGILNSNIVEDFVDSYISWFKSSHILNNIAVPTYNSLDEMHKKIAFLSKEAHVNILSGDSNEAIEEKMNKLVSDLFKKRDI